MNAWRRSVWTCAILLGSACGETPSDAAAPPEGADAGTTPEDAPRDPLLRSSPLRECDASQPARTRLRLMTWNVKAARMAPLEEIVALLRESDADVIALQEIDVGARRTGEVDQPRVMADALGYSYAFAVTVPYDGGLYGIAMLSRDGFRTARRVELPNPGEVAEPAIDALACVGPDALRVIDVHADTDTERGTLNLESVADLVRDDVGQGLAVVGDFNQRPEEPGPRALFALGLVDAFADMPLPTFGSERLDYVVTDPPLALRIVETRRIETSLSDHDALIVELSN